MPPPQLVTLCPATLCLASLAFAAPTTPHATPQLNLHPTPNDPPHVRAWLHHAHPALPPTVPNIPVTPGSTTTPRTPWPFETNPTPRPHHPFSLVLPTPDHHELPKLDGPARPEGWHELLTTQRPFHHPPPPGPDARFANAMIVVRFAQLPAPGAAVLLLATAWAATPRRRPRQSTCI